MYLLDTNVISELRKAAKAEPAVRLWSERHSVNSCYLSVVTLMEIKIGYLRLSKRDETFSNLLRGWLETQLLVHFQDRILPVDVAVSLRCAALHVPHRQPERDALIAATALEHGMTMVTRNISDFEQMGVRAVNPWSP
jgi:toxin FitB